MNSITFEFWIDLVDRLLVEKCGLTSDYLPDCLYHDWYDQGVTPKQASMLAWDDAQDYIASLTQQVSCVE